MVGYYSLPNCTILAIYDRIIVVLIYVRHICRSGWISSHHPSPLWSVWPHVFEAHGWSWTDYFHGKVQTEVLYLHVYLSCSWHAGMLFVGFFSSSSCCCRSGMQGTRTPLNGLWNTLMLSSTWWAESGKQGRGSCQKELMPKRKCLVLYCLHIAVL